MLFSQFSKYLKHLEKTSSRLELTAILKELFAKANRNEIKEVVYLSLGILAPNYESVLLNLAEKMVLRAVSLAYQQDLSHVTKLYKQLGDVGDTAEKLAQYTVHSTQYTVNDVFNKLIKIAKDSGEGSQDRKIEEFANLLKSLDSLSAKYVTRIPIGKLRLGFSEKTVLDALRQVKDEPIEEAYNIHPDIGYIAELVKGHKLYAVSPEIGVPVVPMLAARLNSTTEMIKKMGEVSVEPKFDGLRIFIHFKRNHTVKIFTRNMNAIDINTFPELLDVGKYIKADEVILDTEAVGLDPERQMFVDFQKTVSRRRKHEIEKNSTEIPLQFQVFDIIFVKIKL